MAKKIYKSFIIVTGFSIFTRLMSFIFHIYLSRQFGAENIGIFQITCSILFMFICLSSSGFPVTLSRKIAHYDAIGEYTHSSSLVTSTLVITGSLSILICLFFFAFPSTMNMLFSNPKCKKAFVIMLPSLIASSIYASLRSWFWGKKRYTIYSLMEFADELLLIIVVSVLLAIGNVFPNEGYNTLALGHSLADVICVILLIITFLVFGGKLSKPRYFKELTFASAPITTTRIISSAVSSMIALLLPSLLMRTGLDISTATAEYGRMSGMAMPIILAPGTIVSSLIIVMIPDLASNVSKYGIQSIKDKITSAIVFSTIIAALFSTIFMVCGEDIAKLFYDDNRVGNMIIWSAFIVIPLVLNQLSSSIINTLGKENWTFITSLISSIGLVITVITTSQKLQIYSYTLGLAVYHLIGLGLNTYKIISITKINHNYIFTVFTIFALTIMVAILSSLISDTFGNIHLILRLILSALITGLILILSLLPILTHWYKKYKRNA